MSNSGLACRVKTLGITRRSPDRKRLASMKKEGESRGGELFHFSHPHHPLVQVSFPYLYTCMGCKEYGAGKRLTCEACDFDLHEFCGSAPPSLKGHLFGNKHQLLFLTKSGGFLRPGCDICGKPFKGYAYRCTSCNFEMHPCCSLLHSEMLFPIHPHPLHLSFSRTTSGHSASSCAMCNRRRSGCVYYCKTCEYFCLHAVCAKEMVNGLYHNGVRSPEKPNRLGKAAKAASQVFLELIGGLIEGIGEGIGEALFDSIGKGRRSRSSRSTIRGK